MTNGLISLAVGQTVNWDVADAIGVAADRDAAWVTLRTVYRTLHWVEGDAVHDAEAQAVDEDPPHPSLDDLMSAISADQESP